MIRDKGGSGIMERGGEAGGRCRGWGGEEKRCRIARGRDVENRAAPAACAGCSPGTCRLFSSTRAGPDQIEQLVLAAHAVRAARTAPSAGRRPARPGRPLAVDRTWRFGRADLDASGRVCRHGGHPV